MKHGWRTVAIILLASIVAASPAAADSLDDLARDFWRWRAVRQPLSHDDIPRIERPAGWMPDWSRATVEGSRKDLEAFEARWKAINPAASPVSRQVDYRLIGSALARARWELDITRGWRRNPNFYIQQTIGGLFDLLLQPPPFDQTRSAALAVRMANIPRIVQQAQENLDEAVRPFATLAVAELANVRERLATVSREAAPLLAQPDRAQWSSATEPAIAALESLREWLKGRLTSMSPDTAVGRENYLYFLTHVALVPFTPEELLAMGRQEWERAVAFESYEIQRN